MIVELLYQSELELGKFFMCKTMSTSTFYIGGMEGELRISNLMFFADSLLPKA
jgi:hypothetical protein